jgi:hypothetical protein
MTNVFKVGDHVRWNSEAGLVSGVIIRKLTAKIRFKGHVRHASKAEPQYMIKSDKTDHVAIHKGSALHLKRIRQVVSLNTGDATRCYSGTLQQLHAERG